MASKKKADKDLLVRIRKDTKSAMDHDKENRNKALEDIRFCNVPGEQWEPNQKKERGNRPCYEFNKIRVTVKRIINDMRANRPQGKVRGVEDDDKDRAETMEGLCRNIWNVSDGDTVIDYASEYQVAGGMGAWRVTTEYEGDSFNQAIKIEAIANPFCLYADPSSTDFLKRDAEYWVLTEKLSKKTYAQRYPDAKPVSFDDVEFDDDDDWDDDEQIRIVEYWWKEPGEKELWQLDDGKVVEADQAQGVDPARVVKRRVIKCHKIMQVIASGDALLTQPQEWAGSKFPFVQTFGEQQIIGGKVYWWGVVRFAKDAQRAYNVARTAISEKVAMAPMAKFWATATQAKGNVDKWAEAHKKNYPFLVYNADPAANGPPSQMPSDPVPVSLIQESQLASEEIKSVTGIFDASLGAKSNEQSGKAITARQQQGEIATFNYADNQGKGIRWTWEILLDLIPKVYDTERVLRVLGVDGSEKYVKVNEQVLDPATGEATTLNDLNAGKYDVTVTVGPSYATQRQESAETFIQLAQSFPPLMQVAGDLVFKSMDVPLSDQFAERMKALLPPQVQQQLASGKPIPPEAQAVMQQADMAMQQVQEQTQLVQAAAQEVEQSKAESEKAKAEVEKLISQLEIKKAQFDAHVAKTIADITLKEAEASAGEAEKGAAKDREALATEVQQAVAEIQQMAAQFMQAASQTLAEIQAKQAPQVYIAPPPPRPRATGAVRVPGGMKIVYEPEPTAEPVDGMAG